MTDNQQPKPRKWTAYYITGTIYVSAITTVYADTLEEAEARVTEELNRPGREQYYQLWLRDGKWMKARYE